MKLLALSIDGFRGIQHATIRFGDHDVLVGPNGSGKSTIIDAMSLVFGRTRLVRDLTEHDFHGSCPTETSRILIVATLGGFEFDDLGQHDGWFREGRAVPKWWNPKSGEAEPEASDLASALCAQIAFAARFDLDELIAEQVRYFHDDDCIADPFLEDTIRLNTELVKKPAECLEYIVVHELVHLLEPTHNAHFVALMDKFMPKWQFHRQALNRLPIRRETWSH